jgi:hypothetical protein
MWYAERFLFMISAVWKMTWNFYSIRLCIIQKQTNSLAISQQANYTNWATATDQWILVPTFVDRGVSYGQRGGIPTAVNVRFLDWSRYFFFPVAPHLCSRSWVDPVPDLQLIRKSDSAGNRTRVLCDCSQKLWPLDDRGGHVIQIS